MAGLHIHATMVAEQTNDPDARKEPSFSFPTSSQSHLAGPRPSLARTNVNVNNCQRTVLPGVQRLCAAYQAVYQTDRPPYQSPSSRRRQTHPFMRTPDDDYIIDELAYDRDPCDLNTSFFRSFYLPVHPGRLRKGCNEKENNVLTQHTRS
jgi:hypothetical protein